MTTCQQTRCNMLMLVRRCRRAEGLLVTGMFWNSHEPVRVWPLMHATGCVRTSRGGRGEEDAAGQLAAVQAAACLAPSPGVPFAPCWAPAPWTEALRPVSSAASDRLVPGRAVPLRPIAGCREFPACSLNPDPGSAPRCCRPAVAASFLGGAVQPGLGCACLRPLCGAHK